MRTAIRRTADFGRARCFVALAVALTSTSIFAQVNSWIIPGSGSWDAAASWSLGILPNSAQSVLITNSVWKAVAINPSTPINSPGSMTINNLTMQGATNTENTLLLNYFGTAVPLTVLNGLTLRDGAQILNFNSGLNVQSGIFTVTNSQIIQDGGFVHALGARMVLQNSIYYLTNGVFEGGEVWLGIPISAHFNQYGGSVLITNFECESFSSGTNQNGYSLYGGTINLPRGIRLVGGSAGFSYFQAGGTNWTTQVTIEPDYAGASPSFTLNGGLLADTNMSIIGGPTVNQNGGTHVVTNTLAIAGEASHPTSVFPATYNLNGGTLSAGFIELSANNGDSIFSQTNGTTSAGTIYVHSLGYYELFNTSFTLSGGTLSCSNFFTDDGGGRLNQSGGSLVVSNLFEFGGSRNVGPVIYGRYTFTGESVTASNISITGDWIIGDGSINRISNPGSFSLWHGLTISNAVEQLGRFVLADTAVIDLAGSASQLSFSNSSGETWTSDALLLVTDWNGTSSGGGSERLKFGTDHSGLSAAQLSQMRFRIGTNIYSAKILNTGEVVPDQVVTPPLNFSQQGNQLVLRWLPGYTLQSATSIEGPYANVSDPTVYIVTSPYTLDTTKAPQLFFRLAP